ncbi:MAG: FdtA/QdtA family cupin domain-containing protein [Patescibacteria group bacterium]|nr:FdtA/QdtA family cupin domain-containing protein [Patescibacteria group bacterium]
MEKKEIVKNCYYLEAEKYKDGFDGWLGILEHKKQVPFAIKRVYFIYNLVNHENVVRGKHAHKQLEQAMFCINGSCDIMVDDGVKREKIKLDKTHTGLYLGPKLWHEMRNFDNNCILLVLASDFYDAGDYIRDYQKFIEHIKNDSPGGGGPLFLTDLKM